jgi:uncharacterized membrane protein
VTADVSVEMDPARRTRDLSGRVPPTVVIGGMVLFSLVFSFAHIENHRAFATYSFDTGIYDQAVWGLGHDLNPFMTVRGLPVHGHHLNLILFLLVPVSWLGGGASAFLTVQTLVFASGAWPVFLIARSRFGTAVPRSAENRYSSVPACVLALAYLLSPVVEWVNHSHWHPEAFSGPLFLWTWWFALTHRWRRYTGLLLLLLATREETALTVAMLGIVISVGTWRRHAGNASTNMLVLRLQRRAGLLTALAGIAWFLVATRLVIPAFNNGRPPFYFHEFFATFGGSMGGVVRTVFTDPGLIVSTLTKPDRIHYLKSIGLPTMFVFVLSPLHLLLMAPSLASNLLTDNPYARDIEYQYAAILIGPLWIATIEGAARFRHRRRAMTCVIGAVLVASLGTNMGFSPSPLSDPGDVAYWSRPDARTDILEKAVGMVPPDAGVTATYFIVTHLDRRRFIYDWPNPFVESNWGNGDPVKPTPPPDPATVSWIVADRRTLDATSLDLLRTLTKPGGRFEIYLDESDVVVAGPVRQRPAGQVLRRSIDGEAVEFGL